MQKQKEEEAKEKEITRLIDKKQQVEENRILAQQLIERELETAMMAQQLVELELKLWEAKLS